MRSKSEAELRLSNTYRPDRHGSPTTTTPTAPPPGTPAPKPPAYLGKIAKQEWRRVAPSLHVTGNLQAADFSILASYCSMYAHWRAAEDDIERNGQTIIVRSSTRTGLTEKPAQNPAVRNAIQFQRSMLATAAKFGINPLDRSKVPTPPPAEEEDALERFLNDTDEDDYSYSGDAA